MWGCNDNETMTSKNMIFCTIQYLLPIFLLFPSLVVNSVEPLLEPLSVGRLGLLPQLLGHVRLLLVGVRRLLGLPATPKEELLPLVTRADGLAKKVKVNGAEKYIKNAQVSIVIDVAKFHTFLLSASF